MAIFLAAHTLWDGSLDVWGFYFYHRMEQCCDLIHFLIIWARFYIYEVYGQGSVCATLFSVPNICDFMSFSISARLISCTSVEGCRFRITTRKLLSCCGL